MTTLAITPNWKNKSAKFKGTVAAGEHVSVTILNENGEGGEFIDDASTLRLRVVNPCNGRTLAIFPEPVPEGETPEEWDSDLSPLRCTLNLNTVQMLKAVPPAANVPLLWVLDDYDNNTLYFKEQFEVTHWPRLRGEEEPTDLDNYKDIIADFNDRLDGYDTRITGAENAAQAATVNASAAAATANQAVGIANQALNKAETAQNSAAASAEAAAVAQVAAEAAQVAAEEAAESINSPDATLSEEGVAADAKATGNAIAAEETRATAAEAAEETRAKGVEGGLRTDLTAAEKAIDDEAVLRAAADADLEANKADKATTYTKTEVDVKVAGYVNGAEYDSDEKKILLKHGENTVAEIDATDFIKDGMVSSVEIEDGKLVITFNTDAGLEPIEIPLTDIFDPANYYDKDAVDDLMNGKLDASVAPIPAWKEQTAYAVDDKVHYNGVIYTCKTAHTSGSTFNANRWTATMLPTTGGKMTGAVEIVNQRLHFTNGSGGLYGDIGYDTTSGLCGIKQGEFVDFGTIIAAANGIAPKYSADDTYDLDRLVVYGDVLYKCTTAITTAEAWNSAHWTKATVDDILTALRTALAGKQNTLTFDSEPKDASTNPVTSDGVLSALTCSSIVNRDMRNLKIAGLPASGTGYFVFRTNYNFDYQYAAWDSSRSMWLFPVVIGTNILGLRTTSNPEVYEAILRDPRGTVTHIADLDFTISDTLTFGYNGVAYTVFGVTDDELVKPSDLAGKASTADATLNISASSWTCSPSTIDVETETGTIVTMTVTIVPQYSGTVLTGWVPATDGTPNGAVKGNAFSSDLVWEANNDWVGSVNLTATREVLNGMVLGSQDDKPLASEAEAEALRIGKADRASRATTGNLAALDTDGNPVDSDIPAANVALKADLRYALPETVTTIDSASQDVVSGETINYGEATLADRTQNQVAVLVALDELRITFPAETSGKVRDFGLRVEIGTGSAALAAPALVPIAPTGETIKIENNAAEIPALADGTATAKGVTLLYFSETAPGVFVVKGEQVEEVA